MTEALICGPKRGCVEGHLMDTSCHSSKTTTIASLLGPMTSPAIDEFTPPSFEFCCFCFFKQGLARVALVILECVMLFLYLSPQVAGITGASHNACLP